MKLPFAKDELNADGVALLTYTHGICLGNPALKLLFDPFFSFWLIFRAPGGKPVFT